MGRTTTPIDSTLNEKVNKLERLEKKLIRTRLHGHALTQYLQANVIPIGLQVLNEPAIFVDNPKFKGKFSFISNNCSRHWMVLGVETALEEVERLIKEIGELRNEITEDSALTNAKEALERLERTLKEFDIFTQSTKLDKLSKDIKFFDKKITYPYLTEGYYNQESQGRHTTRGRGGYRRYNTFSNSSVSSGSESEQPSTSAAAQQDCQPNFLDQDPWLEQCGSGRPWGRPRGRGQTPWNQGRGRSNWNQGRDRPGKQVHFQQESHGEIRTRKQHYRW